MRFGSEASNSTDGFRFLPEELPIVLLIIAVATTVRALFGFGDALVAMPLLTLTVGLRTAAPLMALTSGTVAVIILWSSWRNVHVESAWRLVISAICGVPVGIYFLQGSFERPMTALLGAIVTLFAAYSLWTPRRITLNTDRWAYLFGFLAGILGGAYNTNGPPIVIYGTLRRWEPQQFRATLQGFFISSGWTILIAHGAAGLWTRTVLTHYVAALPVVLVTVVVGSRFSKRFESDRFRRYIYVLLLVIGLFLIIRTVMT